MTPHPVGRHRGSAIPRFIFNTGALISGIILVFMMLAIVVEVAIRHSPIMIADFSGYATVRIVFPVLVFAGLGYTWSVRSHVRVESIINRFPPLIHALLDLMICLTIYLLLILLTWVGIKETMHSYITLEEDIDMSIRLYYFKAIVPIGSFVMSFAVLIDIFHILKTRFKK